MTSNRSEVIIYPVQIREDQAAKLQLPVDLTRPEAEKICRVIMALLTTKETDDE